MQEGVARNANSTVVEYPRRSMLTLPCPACAKPTPRLLDESSKGATVNYYRCECGHIWTISKATGKLVSHVTPLTTNKKQPQQ